MCTAVQATGAAEQATGTAKGALQQCPWHTFTRCRCSTGLLVFIRSVCRRASRHAMVSHRGTRGIIAIHPDTPLTCCVKHNTLTTAEQASPLGHLPVCQYVTYAAPKCVCVQQQAIIKVSWCTCLTGAVACLCYRHPAKCWGVHMHRVMRAAGFNRPRRLSHPATRR